MTVWMMIIITIQVAVLEIERLFLYFPCWISVTLLQKDDCTLSNTTDLVTTWTPKSDNHVRNSAYLEDWDHTCSSNSSSPPVKAWSNISVSTSESRCGEASSRPIYILAAVLLIRRHLQPLEAIPEVAFVFSPDYDWMCWLISINSVFLYQAEPLFLFIVRHFVDDRSYSLAAATHAVLVLLKFCFAFGFACQRFEQHHSILQFSLLVLNLMLVTMSFISGSLACMGALSCAMLLVWLLFSCPWWTWSLFRTAPGRKWFYYIPSL